MIRFPGNFYWKISKSYELKSLRWFVFYFFNKALFYFSVKYVPDREVESYQQTTLNSSFKGAFLVSLDEIIHYNKQNIKSSKFLIWKENVYTVQIVVFFQKSSYIYIKKFDEKIVLLKENCCMSFWFTKYLNPIYVIIKNLVKNTEKLNVNQLLGCFQLFTFFLSISIIFFFLELLFYEIVDKKKVHKPKV